ncbi:MAG: aldo/keto reductase [Anaerolineales bacterium]|nr:aldo/keto reductase [Anaerolineales bacterium]
METRRFGRTGHMSSVAIFGGFAISQATQEEADRVVEMVIQAGVNHIDIAPSYGHAEERLGPWMSRERQRFFLGCKTGERSRQAAADELRASLKRLQTDYFDLHQIHAISTFNELDQVTRSGGALEALVEARQAGLTRHIGITGHGVDAPAIFLEALERFDFDSLLFPINYVQYSNRAYRRNAEALIQKCRQRDVGTMIIKSITRGPWGDKIKEFITWYEPFTDPGDIQRAVNFVLSQDITGLCTVGDPSLLPEVLKACQNFTRMDQGEQEALIATAKQYQPLFT